MTLAELRAYVRERIRDDLEPYFFSDPTLAGYLNEAEDEACVRAKLIYDTSKTLTLVADQAVYDLGASALSARFFLFDRFTLAGMNYRVLTTKVVAEMDNERLGWEEAGSGIPEFVLMDQTPRKITLWPTPSSDVDGVEVRLRGFRYPLAAMSADDDEPEIDPQYHADLADWVMARCYSTHDFDTYNLTLSKAHASDFDRAFGPRPDAALLSLMARRETMRTVPRMTYWVYGR